MKKLIVYILVCFVLLSGCNAAKDILENKADALEETIEQKFNEAANALQNANPITGNYTPVAPSTLISPEEAQQIALDHAKLSADEVLGIHTVVQIDNGRQEYEVTFRSGHLEYEYEIDAVTGTVLSVEIDD